MTSTNLYSTLAAASTGKAAQTDPCTPCPVCSGLECLCRPRFYAGQLLTEADLNRLDHYIVAKSRLHNRYLHGWGVACGLEVVCHPCGNSVIVRSGYALSPCGDDIVLCADAPVDICKLIAGCCQPPADPCYPPRPAPPECDEAEQQWILAVCYDEQLSRGVPSLKASNGCAPKCGCGGSGACGCGGSGKQAAAKTSLKPPPVQCEPTAVCESYNFIAYPAPVETRAQPRGAIVERFLNCITRLTQAIPPLPSGQALTLQAVQQWCADLRQALSLIFRTSPGTNCAILDLLNQPCPTPAPGTSPQAFLVQVVQQLAPILIEYLRGCLCSALLPPCPDPALVNCVPLATITVRKKGCKILRICNLEGRKFLTTFPNLQYWLSWIPYVRDLRNALARVCCRIIETRPDPVTPGVKPNFGETRFHVADPATDSGNLTGIAASAFIRRSSTGPKGVEALTYASMGLNTEKGTPFLSEADLLNPVAVAMADELIVPVLSDIFPSAAVAAFTRAGGQAAADDAVRESDQERRLSEMKSQVDELQQTVTKQQLEIDGLIRALRKDTNQ